MPSEHPGKRSDPAYLLNQKRAIIGDLEKRQHESVFKDIGDLFNEARQRKLDFMHPMPDTSGAKVIGTVKQNEA